MFGLFVSAASADHDTHSSPLYFGFALGFPDADDGCDYHGYDCDDSGTSFKIYGGKRLHENLAVEVSFQDLGKLRNDEGRVTNTAESEGVNLSLLGIIPVSEVGYFYGKAGYMFTDTDYTRIDDTTTRSSDDSTDFTYGLGFAFTFDDRYDFRIELDTDPIRPPTALGNRANNR